MNYVWFAIGFILATILSHLANKSYKRLLVMKAKDGSSEYINGKFYKIIPENRE